MGSQEILVHNDCPQNIAKAFVDYMLDGTGEERLERIEELVRLTNSEENAKVVIDATIAELRSRGDIELDDIADRIERLAKGTSKFDGIVTRKPVKYLVKQVDNADGSILYTLKTVAGKEFDILYDVNGFPVFDEAYHMILKSEDLLKSRTTHFSRAGKDLYAEMLKDSNLMSKFTDAEIAKFKAGLVPEKWTWHHHQETGLMQLVLKEFHEVASHTGGISIWGSGN